MSYEQDTTEALNNIANALLRLGNADAATPMGGLEAHGAAVLEAAQIIADGLQDVAEAIREQKNDS